MKSDTKDLFSLKYYHASLTDEDLELIKSSIDLDPKLVNALTEGTWQQECKTSFPNFLETEDYKNGTGNTVLDVKNFSEIVLKHFDEYVKLATKSKKYFQLELMHSWLNKYNKGDSQEPHHHASPFTNFSGCIFLNFNKEKDAKFYFYDENVIHLNQWYTELFFDDTDKIYPEINQGDIILFPSTSWHGVQIQRESTNRTTLSFNFKVQAL